MQSLSYASPKALLNALLPQATPFALSSSQQPTSRIAAFKRFISDLEARGGGDPVPPFPPNADWLNAPPLRFDRELRGKVVVLDFWTYCCINCMHILPDLAYLEGKYASQPVAVVGVHSAKFDNEQDTDAIRSAVLRYDIRHPVVNDRGMTLWRALGVSSWPTLAVLSPQGRLIVSLPGEGHRQDLDDILAAALEYYGEQGMLDTSPVPSALERDRDPRLAASPLRFPGKVAVDEIGARLFISDSGNHRVVVTDLGGKFLEAVGGNGPGLRDGAFSDAAFNRPQGLAYSAAKGVLYVCDTESHAVRAVDFKQRSVRTVAGNGAKGDDYQGGRSGAAQQLNSPWDCALVSTAQRSSGSATEVLYVAMAGQHQIWAVHPDTGRAQNFSGTGNERNQNGPGPLTTSWAQPSGLALLPGTATLFVADSESSSVRKLDLATGGSSACAGGDPLFSDNLFKFGDVDGIGAGALLQHPLAVAVSHDGTAVYVADSYNHRIKRLDPGTCAVTSLAGSGRAGFQDGQGANAHFSEPGGLAVASDGRLFVADTNNGVIRVFNPSKKAVSTLKLAGVPPPRVSPDAAPAWAGEAADLPPGATLVKAQTPVRPGSGRINIKIALPAGYHLTEGANSRFECAAATPDGTSLGSVSFDPVKGPLKEDGKGGVTAAVGYATAEPGMLRVLCTVYFCQDRSVCLFEEVAFEVEVREGGADGNDVELGYQLSAKAPVVDLP